MNFLSKYMPDVPRTAFILAGGFGTRLASVISDLPKPMAPVHGRPFLEYLMDHWIGQGIESFVLCTGYLGEKISGYFGQTYRNRAISYMHETTPLGTGGGFRQALFNCSVDQGRVVLLNGDTWYPVQLASLCSNASLPVTIALKPMLDNQRYGAVTVVQKFVTAFGAETFGSCLINGGCYLIEIPPIIKQLRSYPQRFSLEQDFLPQMASKGLVGASRQDATFLDIGIPEDYLKAAEFLPPN
jgi:D-glycero-alpha-D-manno-heptose 1-phosphate guanylyltransferase